MRHTQLQPKSKCDCHVGWTPMGNYRAKKTQVQGHHVIQNSPCLSNHPFNPICTHCNSNKLIQIQTSTYFSKLSYPYGTNYHRILPEPKIWTSSDSDWPPSSFTQHAANSPVTLGVTTNYDHMWPQNALWFSVVFWRLLTTMRWKLLT